MTTTKEALEPQAAFTIRWCPVCGRDDRINSFKAAHYSRGELCRGVPITIEYSRVPAPIAPVVDEQKTGQDAQFEYCPSCAGELDTGYECLKCGRDWRPWATFAPDSIRDEGYGWCVWRFEEGVWRTDCGDQFTLDDGTPKENEMAYCCFCGGVLGEVDNEC